ncbi:MAG TPA: ABC transporter permease [Aquabacterium sp.]|nr:ABC transporter permease [Aquabacterium sp.]
MRFAPALDAAAAAVPRRHRWLHLTGKQALRSWRHAAGTLDFLGQVMVSLGRLLRGRAQMRRSDLLLQIDQTGPRSVPIVAIVCGLVGLILAYMGALQLQRFGAQAFIADLVSVGVVREIAALMTGVILSGRVSAAFAAQLGAMHANDEIDALRVLGIDPIDH